MPGWYKDLLRGFLEVHPDECVDSRSAPLDGFKLKLSPSD